MCAYALTPLDEDTIKLTSFASGDKLFAFIQGFYGLKGLSKFFTKISNFFSDDEDHINTRIPPSRLTQHYKQKTILFSTSRHLTPHKYLFLQ